MITEGYIYIPMEVLYYNITPQSKLLYGLLYKETNKGQRAYTKEYRLLAITLDVTPRTIYRSIKELKENNLIHTKTNILKQKEITLIRPEYQEPKTLAELFRRIK